VRGEGRKWRSTFSYGEKGRNGKKLGFGGGQPNDAQVKKKHLFRYKTWERRPHPQIRGGGGGGGGESHKGELFRAISFSATRQRGGGRTVVERRKKCELALTFGGLQAEKNPNVCGGAQTKEGQGVRGGQSEDGR